MSATPVALRKSTMRVLPLVLVAAFLAAALPTNALPAGARLYVDGGGFSYDCGEFPAGGTVQQALDACAAAQGFTTVYGFGGCFLLAVNGQYGQSLDPSGFWLLGEDWYVRENGAPSDTGVCAPLRVGTLVTVDYELVAGWVAATPRASTAIWIAQHLA